MVPHPLREILATANRHERWLPVILAEIDHEQSLATLVNDRERLLNWASAVGDRLGAEDARVGPTLLFESLVGLTALALIGPYFMARRLPLAGVAQIEPRFDPGNRPEELRLAPGPFACLPEDKAADHPLAIPVASSGELFARLREQLIVVSEPLVQAMARPARRGLRTQWRGVSDRVTNAAWYAGIQAGDETAGMALAEALCDGREPLLGRPNFRSFDYEGITHTHRVRNTCCQHFRLPTGRLCFTCPLTKAKDRDQFWRARYD
ncbi:MAG: (2Fe-2S)-binding protein, partial [Halomonas sp.]